MQIQMVKFRAYQGGTGIPDSKEDMPGKSLYGKAHPESSAV